MVCASLGNYLSIKQKRFKASKEDNWLLGAGHIVAIGIIILAVWMGVCYGLDYTYHGFERTAGSDEPMAHFAGPVCPFFHWT